MVATLQAIGTATWHLAPLFGEFMRLIAFTVLGCWAVVELSMWLKGPSPRAWQIANEMADEQMRHEPDWCDPRVRVN